MTRQDASITDCPFLVCVLPCTYWGFQTTAQRRLAAQACC